MEIALDNVVALAILLMTSTAVIASALTTALNITSVQSRVREYEELKAEALKLASGYLSGDYDVKEVAYRLSEHGAYVVVEVFRVNASLKLERVMTVSAGNASEAYRSLLRLVLPGDNSTITVITVCR